jgi:hypothetical protein
MTLVVPFSAGESSDAIARIVVDGISNNLRQAVVSDQQRCHGTFIKSVQATDLGCKGPFAFTELAPTEGVLGPFLWIIGASK